ncbi:Gfo/Idh/MocA family oxidoreductase [Kaistia dalseonensis]|uniref:Dehydrogenase n=1 Tax=Kaistia dalseonensis TaxID=410840 RepID=A0ABU0H9Y5_9HYPH|nr:Gfo/Idh/MocA family oxidoreductase [Kaistia dalseonensis]MCX5496490.1 Gfo/Idh/MocA family oxidoreductase [Kaistia dalseonensis]MDQ0439112.1 putative dehydrogenase [Kaistia dalseonensis]
MLRFAAIGLDHGHIVDQIGGLLAAGAVCAGYDPETSDPLVLGYVQKNFPDLQPVARERLLDDPTIDLICTAAIPRDRAGIAIDAMTRGKDVMSDKPGALTLDQLDAIRRTVAETGRLYSVSFTERFSVPSALVAAKLVVDGAIGRVVQTVGLGPHRLNRAIRPAWFFDTDAGGGILTDIAAHQFDQFLFYTGSKTAEIVASTVGNFGTPENPDFNDFGDVMLRSDHATGYARVDWFTPDGLPTWGDGRMTLLGTEGYIELRKYVDIEGRPGKDHLFIADRAGTRYIDCSGEPLIYYRQIIEDVRERTETACPMEHTFEATRLSIVAQSAARRMIVA